MIIGYRIKATIEQSFGDSLKYPFDRAVVRLRVRHPSVDHEVVLIPDLDAYRLLSPTALPGVGRSFSVPGFRPEISYFGYAMQGYDVNFGIPGGLARGETPELGFNLVLQRRLLDPFISTLLPLVVVAFLLFGLLLIGTRIKEKVAATGFKPTDVLRACVSLLFPVLVAQINLRTKVAASGLIYMECFYFVMYTAILFVSGNAIAFTHGDHGLLHIRDNAVPKLLYWPMLLGLFFIITLVFLY